MMVVKDMYVASKTRFIVNVIALHKYNQDERSLARLKGDAAVIIQGYSGA
jgi:hypothetical protein